jgi:hypothetical protein
MYWYIPACTRYVLVCTSTFSYVQVHTSVYCTYTSKFMLAGIYWYKLVHARLSLLVLSHTALYPLVLFWIRGGTRRYKAVKIGTMRYKAVPESPVPLDMEVQGSTWRYKALYRLVPPYPGVQDFLVLPCTALYRLVSRSGQGGMRENQNLRNY